MQGGFDGFEWGKGNRAKCGKHGVSTNEIEALFLSVPRVAPDPRHSDGETRFIAVGRNPAGRPIFVALTYRTRRGLRLIRPVSARFMHDKEIRAYETSHP